MALDEKGCDTPTMSASLRETVSVRTGLSNSGTSQPNIMSSVSRARLLLAEMSATHVVALATGTKLRD